MPLVVLLRFGIDIGPLFTFPRSRKEGVERKTKGREGGGERRAEAVFLYVLIGESEFTDTGAGGKGCSRVPVRILTYAYAAAGGKEERELGDQCHSLGRTD